MNELYQYTTVEQQIQKLKSQKLLFEDENIAKQTLKTYGYYNIINGYRDPYIIRDYNGKNTVLMLLLNKFRDTCKLYPIF